MNPRQTTALAYEAKGLSVFPLQPNEKLPAIKWEQFMTERPHRTQIASWWSENPDYNIAVITGQISGITVVDFDVKNGSISPLFKQMPPTITVKTPTGGYHCYYKYTPDIKQTVDYFRDGSGVDIRNDGGYVAAPPSCVNGICYKTIAPGVFADFPVHLFTRTQQTKERVPLTKLVGLEIGNRNSSLASIVGKLFRVTPVDKWDAEVWPVLLAINKTYTPPLPEEEVRTIYNSIYSKAKLDTGGQPSQVKDFLNTIDAKELDNIKDLAAKNAFMNGLATYSGDDAVISSDELLKIIQDEGPQEKFYTGWLSLDALLGGFTPGQLIVLSAPTKSGKTTWSMALTLLMEKYAPCWFPFEEGAKELISKFVERNQTPPKFFVPKVLIDNKTEWIEKRIIESLLKNQSRIVFIDQLDWLTNEKQFLGQEINNIMKELKRIAQTWKVVIILMAHITKLDPETPPTMNDLRDSGNIANKCDTLIMLWRKTEKHNKMLNITNKVNVGVLLNRRTGKTGNIQFVYENGMYIENNWLIEDVTDRATF